MTAPHAVVGRQPRGRTKVRSKMWLDWRAWERSVTARTDQAFTLDRTTVGTARTDTLLYEAVHSQPRWSRVTANDGETYTVLLLEGGRTNLLTRSEEFDHGDWPDDAGTPTVTADDAEAPDGTTTADKIEDDNGSGVESIKQEMTVADDTVARAASVFVKKNSGGPVVGVGLVYVGGTTSNNVVTLDPGDGTVAMDSARQDDVDRFGVEDFSDDFYRLWLVCSNNGTGNTTARVSLYPAWNSSGNTGSLAASATGTNHFWGAQFEEGPVPSSYAKTTSSTFARDAELFQTTDVGLSPQDIVAAGGLTVLTEWVELGTAFAGGSSIYALLGGPTPGSDPRLLVYSDSVDGKVLGFFDNGASAASSVTGAGTISLFDHVRARVVFFLDSGNWKVQLHTSVNGAAEVSASAATIGSTLPDTWSANTFTIGAAPDDTLHGFSGMARVAIAPGVRTLDYMTV